MNSLRPNNCYVVLNPLWVPGLLIVFSSDQKRNPETTNPENNNSRKRMFEFEELKICFVINLNTFFSNKSLFGHRP